MRHALAIAAALLALSACKPQEDGPLRWLGESEDQLVSTWGAPTETLTAEDGARVLVFRRGPADDPILPSSGQGRDDHAACETTFTLERGRVVGYTLGRDCSISD